MHAWYQLLDQATGRQAATSRHRSWRGELDCGVVGHPPDDGWMAVSSYSSRYVVLFSIIICHCTRHLLLLARRGESASALLWRYSESDGVRNERTNERTKTRALRAFCVTDAAVVLPAIRCCWLAEGAVLLSVVEVVISLMCTGHRRPIDRMAYPSASLALPRSTCSTNGRTADHVCRTIVSARA